MWAWLKKLFCAIFKCPKPDIEIRICLENPTPTKARIDCPHTEVRKYPEGTVFPICVIDHNQYTWVDVCKDTGFLPNYPWCPDTEEQIFLIGKEPIETCDIHFKLDPKFKKENVNMKYSSFFCPDLLLNYVEISNKDFKDFIDKAVKTGAFNNPRMHGYAKWGGTDHLIYHPHPKDAHGKYLIYKINPDWLNLLTSRLDYIIETRGVNPSVDVVVCAITNDWGGCWLNPANNYENTHEWNRAFEHFYEYQDHPEVPPDEQGRYQNTGKYFLWFHDWFVGYLENRYPKKITFCIHEAKAGSNWHKDIIFPIFHKYGIGKDRIMTNIDITEDKTEWRPWENAEWPEKFIEENVLDFAELSIHGVCDRDLYNYLRKQRIHEGITFRIIPNRPHYDIPYPVILSGDGMAQIPQGVSNNHDPKNIFWITENTVIELVVIVRRNGHLALEVNMWNWGIPFRQLIDDDRYWSIARALRDAVLS